MLDTFCYYYYLVHIPVTLLIDSTAVLPPLFTFQKAICDFHVQSNHDILMINKPVWFQYFVWVELLFQLPFFFYHVFVRHSRVLNIAYGVNASFTTVVCLLYVTVSDAASVLSPMEKLKLSAVYVPYAVIPAVIAVGWYQRARPKLE